MAKIILKDRSEYNVTDSIAQQLWALKGTEKNKETQVTLGNVGTTIGAILKVIFDEAEEIDAFSERLKKLHEQRRTFLKLTPREKAQQNSWGHFSFFFEGVYGKKPNDSLKEKVISAAEVYYRKNPFVDRPIMALWQKVLQIKEGTPANSVMLRILSMQDAMAYKIIKEDAEFESRMLRKELSTPEISL